MVVVAEEVVGDAAEDTPVSIRSNADSVETTKTYCHNPIDQWKTDVYNDMLRTPSYSTQLLLVTGPSVDLYVPLYDGNVPLDRVLAFSSSTARTRDIIHAVASHCGDNLLVGSFTISMVIESRVPWIKLDDDEKTIRDYDIYPRKMQILKMVIEREDPSDWQTSEHVVSDVWLELRLVDARDSDEKVKLHWSLLVQKTTKASDVWAVIIASQRLPDIKGNAPIMLEARDLKISNVRTSHTLEELGFEFSVPDSMILELTNAEFPEIYQKFRSRSHRVRGKSKPLESEMWSFQCMVNSESDVKQNDAFAPLEFSPQSPETEARSEAVYVGLVNQAMTCYLNSLLQALYMTPEFRNALYNWVYAEASEKDEASSMPYQLQKLFLNLQTSTKNAVETTALTKSFGWDSTEAWQQHDIQELCRVMFDALEQKFKNTEQADLINQLYEGKMIDYVKCLECSTEKSREDTFLDIPLPVRPFGSTVAYNSVEEALQAFVQPETLDEANQYFCETCNKKCDAHKGLKFTKFPYLLTLHLKRFDFDYSTYHRIKLNDKVTFPDTLHLNSFIAGSNSSDPPSEDEHEDGSSDSTAAAVAEETPVDEECPSTSSGQQSERNRKNQDCKGPYHYELFSIMIHSGNASGGHYYAYIKDFETNEWLCFNDQNVSPITRDDIQKTYGGGPSRAYYSGAYSSSTNAYMLMYRQIDPTRNLLPMKVDEFPKHIQDLLIKIKEQEEEKRNNMRSRSMTKTTVYVYHPKDRVLTTTKMLIQYDTTLNKMLERAYKNFNLEGVVDFDQCRLVQYRPAFDVIELSYDGMENQPIETLGQQTRILLSHMLLEIRDKDAKFVTYPVHNITTFIYVIDATTRRMIGAPFIVRAPWTTTLGDFMSMVAQMLPSHLQRCAAKLFLTTLETDRKILHNTDTQLENVVMYYCGKSLLAVKPDVSGTIVCEQLHGMDGGNAELMEKVDKIVMLHLPLPDTRKEVLEKMNITPWENRAREVTTNGPTKTLNGDVTAKFGKGDPGDVSTNETKSTAVVPVEGEEWQEQSNSEDSSLSDSDRTLVGDASEDDEFGLTDAETELYKVGANRRDAEEEDWFFMVGERIKTPIDRYKLYVDKHIVTDALKKHIEPLIKVAAKDFDIHRQSFNSEEMRLFSTSSSPIFDDGDTIIVKLRRSLRDNEFKVFLYNFHPIKNLFVPKYMCSWVICEDSTVGPVKKEIAAEFNYKSIRLRKNNNKLPGKVLLDHQKIKDLDLRTTAEIIIQELPVKDDPVTDPNQILVIAWKYQCLADSSSQKCGEIVLNSSSLVELRDKLVEFSGIAAEKLMFFVDTWPTTSTRSTKKDSPVGEWRKFADCESETITIDDSSTVFYKEITEDTKDENLPLFTEIRFYRRFDDSPPRRETGWRLRRELGLKIHLDDK